MKKMDMSLINTLFAIKNTLGEISVRGDENVSNMTACFRALDGCIEALTKHAEEQKKAEEDAEKSACEAKAAAEAADQA